MTGENLLNAVTDKLMALTQVAQQPHNSQDMVVKPNVVVAHLQQGVEVLHYYSGRTLTQVALSPGATYADVNGDMKIDRVHMTESSGTRGQLAPCCADLHILSLHLAVSSLHVRVVGHVLDGADKKLSRFF